MSSFAKGKLKVILNSNAVEFTKDSAILAVNGATQRIPNDFVWIFAGGEPPTAFLKKIGAGFDSKDLTSEGSSEAKAVKERYEMAGVTAESAKAARVVSAAA